MRGMRPVPTPSWVEMAHTLSNRSLRVLIVRSGNMAWRRPCQAKWLRPWRGRYRMLSETESEQRRNLRDIIAPTAFLRLAAGWGRPGDASGITLERQPERQELYRSARPRRWRAGSRDRFVRRTRADHPLRGQGCRDPLRQHGLCPLRIPRLIRDPFRT